MGINFINLDCLIKYQKKIDLFCSEINTTTSFNQEV